MMRKKQKLVTLAVDRGMRTIRVVVANRPRLMRDLMLAILSDQPDIEVLGTLENESQVAERLTEWQPDFVIVGLDRPGQRPVICDYILLHHPFVKILAVSENDNSVLFWADIRSARVENSEEGILNLLRGQVVSTTQRTM